KPEEVPRRGTSFGVPEPQPQEGRRDPFFADVILTFGNNLYVEVFKTRGDRRSQPLRPLGQRSFLEKCVKNNGKFLFQQIPQLGLTALLLDLLEVVIELVMLKNLGGLLNVPGRHARLEEVAHFSQRPPPLLRVHHVLLQIGRKPRTEG